MDVSSPPYGRRRMTLSEVARIVAQNNKNLQLCNHTNPHKSKATRDVKNSRPPHCHNRSARANRAERQRRIRQVNDAFADTFNPPYGESGDGGGNGDDEDNGGDSDGGDHTTINRVRGRWHQTRQ